MTRTTRSLIRLSIAISLIVAGAATGYTIVAVLATLWFLTTLKRDEREITKEAVGSRLDKIKADYKKYPYKGRLNR